MTTFLAQVPSMASAADRGRWTYRQPRLDALVEIGTVSGCQVALPPHFHDEDQWVHVVAGRRRFVIGGVVHEVGRGQWFCIPAGTLHGSLAEAGGVACINLYLVADAYAPAEVHRYLREAGSPLSPGREAGGRRAADAGRWAMGARIAPPIPGLDPLDTVEAMARSAGLSREHFSRVFRKRHGLAPEHYRLLLRLTHARRYLKDGLPIAAAAAEAGFADQSHLGRSFKRFFGVTPGRYRQD